MVEFHGQTPYPVEYKNGPRYAAPMTCSLSRSRCVYERPSDWKGAIYHARSPVRAHRADGGRICG